MADPISGEFLVSDTNVFRNSFLQYFTFWLSNLSNNGTNLVNNVDFDTMPDQKILSNSVDINNLNAVDSHFWFSFLAPFSFTELPFGDAFCSDSEGWGPWNAVILDFTPCFEFGFLVEIPHVLLLLFGVFRMFSLVRSSTPSAPSSPMYILKLVLASIFLLNSVITTAATQILFDNVKPYHRLDDLTSILGALLILVLVHFEHLKSKSGSAILLLYWLSSMLLDLVVLRSLYIRVDLLKDNDLNTAIAISKGVSFFITLFLFILENMPKPKSHYLSLDEDANQTPEERANIFSLLTFHWIDPLMKLGYSKDLEMEDLWSLKKDDSSHYNSESFNSAWIAETKKKNPSLYWALLKCYGPYYSLSSLYKAFHDMCAFLQPLYLKTLILFAASWSIESKNEPQPLYQGFAVAVVMFLTAVVQTMLLHQYFHVAFISGMRIRGAIVSAIYRKALHLSNASRQSSTTGEIVNLMSVDAAKIMDTVMYFNIIWSAPFQIAMALYLLYNTLGISIFAGVSVMVIMIPVNTALVSVSRELNKIQMKNKDNRTKLMDEVLNGIKVIKLYAWENSFMKKILDVRELELKTLKKVGYLSSVFSFIWSSTPFLVSFLSFTMYSIIETEPLTSTKIFVSLSLFNLLQFPLSVLPSVITSLVEASVSVNRLRNFLLNEELDRDAVVHDSTINGPDSLGLKVERVTVKNGSFRWSKNSESPDLKNISFSVSDRTLLSICGRVGAGKSSILSALLGEMYKDHGEVFVHGSVAYVPQTAWIMNQTVRENILFGKKFDAAYYEQTIAACGLQQDLEMLPAGDLTEIGERGINLSGGQKQRISLARAVYARTDIYLLDDPLSAVDAHVGAHIFEKVLGPRGLLKDKCRIFVTHAIQFIPQSDLILNLSNGSIDEIGTYDELMSWESNTKTLLREYGKRKEEDKESIDIEDENEPHSKQSSAKKPDTAPAAANGQVKEGKLMTKEESAKGAVAWDVYISYGQACGVITVIIYLIFATMSQMLSVGQNLYLADWASSNDNKKRDEVDENVFQRLTVYGILGLVSSIFIIIQVIFVWVFCAVRSARITHEAMLKTVLHAPQSFFDVTPLGRILNRFSKDQYAVDEVLPRTFQMFFRTLFNVISVLFVNAIATPLFLVFTLPLGFLYHHFQRYYLATSRELKRLDSTTRSPIYAHFSETLGGVVTIRAYRMDARFMQANDEKVDYNQKAYYASISSNRWLAVRLEFIGSLIVFGSAFFAVLTIYFYGTIPASVVGLMLTYSLNVTQTLNWWVRQSCEIETNIVSVERIKEYSELPTEAAEYTSYPLPDQWPDKGIIKFDSYSTKYRAELDLVLRQISFETKAGEKIGIVGRTGAGKSSLTLSLFRMIEPTDGSILIDGEDITKIGLQDLRSRITIIPQDPVLFAGTVRSNLDPFTQYDDEAVWKSLESANLKDKIMEMDGKLEAVVVQGGENFSVGQRQLVCLARALLRKSKILVLDEATAAIDVETDDIIQKVIRREFSDCTTLTIAHRINTVIDCDRILVLDKGQVAEFDSPEKLLADKRSIFYGLASEAGLLL